MQIKHLSIVVLLAMGALDEVKAASPTTQACLSREAARKIWPRTYLYWKRGPSGARCWSDRRGGRTVQSVRPAPLPSSQEAPLVIPPEAVPSIPKPEPLPMIKWEWEPRREEPFSTFAQGEEPDIWPKLEDNSRHFEWLAGFMAALLAYWLWRRWERRKLNVKN